MDENKKRALDAAILKIEKDFGKGAVMRLGDPNAMGNVEVVPTGALSLDIALGLGGIPKGRVVEVYGPESSGKTTVSLHMVSEIQKRGGIAAFIDAEHALDPKYAKNIDRPILRAALNAKVDVLLTGDKDFLESGVTNPKIMTAAEFIAM